MAVVGYEAGDGVWYASGSAGHHLPSHWEDGAFGRVSWRHEGVAGEVTVGRINELMRAFVKTGRKLLTVRVITVGRRVVP